eukprot:350440-Chlamydomonas_euryale.AAC.2
MGMWRCVAALCVVWSHRMAWEQACRRCAAACGAPQRIWGHNQMTNGIDFWSRAVPAHRLGWLPDMVNLDRVWADYGVGMGLHGQHGRADGLADGRTGGNRFEIGGVGDDKKVDT